MVKMKKSKNIRKDWGGAVGDKLAELFNRTLPDGTPLVPPEGNASTDIGQLVRGMNKIMYRYYNDGDIAGIGYGRETLDWVFDYMKQNANDEIYSALEDFYDKYSSYDFEHNFREMSDSEREDYVNEALGTDFSYRYGDEDEPEEPDRDDYDSDEEYEDAMDSYEQEKEEYDELMEKREEFDYYMDEPGSFIMDYGDDYVNSAIEEAEDAGYERDMIALASMIVSYVESKWVQMVGLDQANEEDIDNYATDSWDYYEASAKKSKMKKSDRCVSYLGLPVCPECGSPNLHELESVDGRVNCKCDRCDTLCWFDDSFDTETGADNMRFRLGESTKKSKPVIKMSFNDNVNAVRKTNYAKTGNINTVMKNKKVM